MSAAVMTSPMFDCGDLLLRSAAVQKKEPAALLQSNSSVGSGNTTSTTTNGHAPLRRSCTSVMSLYEQHRKLDRSVSEPASRYKTELCRPFEESGVCKYADKCQFAHGYGELRNLQRHPKYKTVMCRTYHSIGFCPYGPRCHFVHNFEEARSHNQKVSASTNAQANLINLNQRPLNSNNNNVVNSSINMAVLEQLAARTMSLQIAQIAQNNANAAAAVHKLYDDNAAYFESLAPNFNNRPLLTRANSLGFTTTQSNAVGATRPKPLTLSPTFSLGSTADSISPSSSLSQSPTNSMASFFSDEPAGGVTPSPFAFSQDFSLRAGTRQSPSPQGIIVGGASAIDDLAPRTPSPLSPTAESRLPVFNRISSTASEFEYLKI